MRRAAIDQSIQRVEVAGFAFPLGVFPLAPSPASEAAPPSPPITPAPGYTEVFEPADGGESPGAYLGSGGFDDWEEWPDRFVYDILLPASRIRPLCRALIAMLPGRVYPILDVLGTDAYREIDPHLAYELVGIERFYDGVRDWDDWLFEDGLVGFGAMSVEPFFYFFLDEHKIVTVRAELAFKDRIEKLLVAFDLSVVEELQGADSFEHEHRGVLLASPDDPDRLTADEIIERLRDAWGLQLNIDSSSNVDDDNNDLGVTPWQCIVRCSAPYSLPSPSPTTPSTSTSQDQEQSQSSEPVPADEPDEILAYAEILLSADNIETAERLATEAVDSLAGTPEGGWAAIEVIKTDRVLRDQLEEWLAESRPTSPGLSQPAQPSRAPAGVSPGSGPKRKAGTRPTRKADPEAIKVYDVRWLVEPAVPEPTNRPTRRAPRDPER